MNILVTGSSGFIGGHVAIDLAKRNKDFKIVATGRSATNKFQNIPNVTYKQLDLSREIEPLSFDVCVHAAGLVDDKSSDEKLEMDNVQATANLMKALRDCKVFVYLSSASVYDFADGKSKSEEDALVSSNISAYGRSKLKGEGLVLNFGFPSVYSIRPRAVYGQGDRAIMPRILKLVGKRLTVIPGPLKARTSMTHIQNLCDAIYLCIETSKPGAHVYNITDPETYNFKDIFAEIAFWKYGHRNFFHIPLPIVNFIIAVTKLFGIRSVLTRQSVNYLSQDSILSIEKAIRELGYRPSRTFFSTKDEIGSWIS